MALALAIALAWRGDLEKNGALKGSDSETGALHQRKRLPDDNDDDTRAFRKIPQRNAIPTAVNTDYLFKFHAKAQAKL